MAVKICTTCLLPKDLENDFWRSRNGRTKDGYKNECKDCAKARRRDWAAHNREREAEWNRLKYLASPESYKIRAADYVARKIQAFVEQVDPLIVLERYDGVCGICLDDVDPLRFEVDHIIPLSRGGEHSYANTQPSHPSCNAAKGDKVLV